MTKAETAAYFSITSATLCNWVKGDDGKRELHKAAFHWIVAKDIDFKQVVRDLDTISLLNDMGGENKSIEKRLQALRAVLVTLV